MVSYLEDGKVLFGGEGFSGGDIVLSERRRDGISAGRKWFI